MRQRAAALVALLLAMPLVPPGSQAHEGHEHFSAGAPGDPNKPARTVQVSMREDGKKMSYEPSIIEVRRGEQIRFVISNDGIYNHEFMLATVAENRKHGALMKKYPDMEHEDPNAVTVAPYVAAELLWTFTRKGEFEFACLVPGHYEAGMHGRIIVK
jgi:uncharacterized cupredoxin-like copper-binding protein